MHADALSVRRGKAR